MLYRFRSGGLRTPTVVLLLMALGAATSACEHHVRVPASDYARIEQKVTDEWEIETQDAVYRVNWFTVTDSTLVILDAQWMRLDAKQDRYPGNPVKSIDNPEVPIVLPLKDVKSVENVEFSWGRTTLGVIVVPAVIGTAAFLILYAGAGAGGSN